MQLKVFYCNPFRECTYVVSAINGDCAIIDCGAFDEHEWSRIYDYIQEKKLKPCMHLLTHAHLDHCFGAYFVKRDFGVLPTLSTADEYLYQNLNEQALMFGLQPQVPFLAEFLPLNMGKDISLKEITISIIPTPGHTDGGVCFLLKWENNEDMLLSGDTLFYAGYGRTDLPGGDAAKLIKSLQLLFQLKGQTIVYPGHGIATTIEREKNRY